eukprot:354602-Chlamydomonas_euryale.AAC.4
MPGLTTPPGQRGHGRRASSGFGRDAEPLTANICAARRSCVCSCSFRVERRRAVWRPAPTHDIRGHTTRKYVAQQQ